jgi:hypothetical protein
VMKSRRLKNAPEIPAVIVTVETCTLEGGAAAGYARGGRRRS